MVVDADSAPRILILRRDNIGDLVCTTPLIAALRAQLPGAWHAEVLVGNSALDEVFVHEKLKHRSGSLLAHLRSRLGQQSRLRQRKIDCVLVPASSPQALKLARSLKPGRVLAAPVSVAPRQHEVERVYDLGRSLGLGGKPGPLRIFPDEKKVLELKQKTGAGPFVAIHISARRPTQRWPLARYTELIKHLSVKHKVMLLWAPGTKDDPRHPGDDLAAGEIIHLAKGANFIPIETPDLKTLIAALSLAELVVCPDGGAMHLAAALGKPVVALFGDSPIERWRPWGVPHRVLRPESRNLADLPLEPVVAAFGELAHPGEAKHHR